MSSICLGFTKDEATLLERNSKRSIAEVVYELALSNYLTTIKEEKYDLILVLRIFAHS